MTAATKRRKGFPWSDITPAEIAANAKEFRPATKRKVQAGRWRYFIGDGKTAIEEGAEFRFAGIWLKAAGSFQSYGIGYRRLTPSAPKSQKATGITDTQILDWMQKHRADVRVGDEEPLPITVQSSEDYKHRAFINTYDIRKGVRAAMKGSK